MMMRHDGVEEVRMGRKEGGEREEDGREGEGERREWVETTDPERGQVKTRTSFDGPAWFHRKRTGYKGLAWFDLPLAEPRLRGEVRERRRRKKGPPPSKPSFLGREQCNNEPFPSKALLQMEDERLGKLQLQKSHELAALEATASAEEDRLLEDCSESVCSCGDDQVFPVTNETKRSIDETLTELDKLAEEARELRVRELILAKANARRLELRSRERVHYKFGLKAVPNIESDDYQLPRTRALHDAKRAAEDVQSSAVRRNWKFIRRKFELVGDVMSLEQLRQALVECGLSAPHAGRVVLQGSNQMLPGEDLLSYDDFMVLFFDDGWSSSEDDGEDQDQERHSEDNRLTETESNGDTAALEQEDPKAAKCISAELAADIQAAVAKPRRNSDVGFSKGGLHAKVHRLRRKIKAAVSAKGIPAGGPVKMNDDQILAMLGFSVVHLRELDKRWLQSKPHRKASAIVKMDLAMRLQGTLSPRSTSSNVVPSRRFTSLEVTNSALKAFGDRRTTVINRQDLGMQKSLFEAVDLLQSLACRTLQSLMRGFLIRKRAQQMREDRLVAKAIFRRNMRRIERWFAVSKREQFMSRHVRKIFCRWRGYVRLQVRQRNLFRVTFWPFHVWRKYAFRKCQARDKAKFLRRVWATLRTLQHFRAWARTADKAKARVGEAIKLLSRLRHESKADHFGAWVEWWRNQKRLNFVWEAKGAGLRHRIRHRKTLTAWCGWKMVARASRCCRVRSLREYNYVSSTFDEKQKYFRQLHALVPRNYAVATLERPQKFPGFYEMLGPVCEAYLKRHRGPALDALFDFHSSMVEQDRYMRATVCIERNRLGPLVFARWRGFVEAQQKSRYAWFHFSTSAQRKMLRRWRSVLPAFDQHGNRKSNTKAGKKRASISGSSPIPGSRIAPSPKNSKPRRNTLYLPGRNANASEVSSPECIPERKGALRRVCGVEGAPASHATTSTSLESGQGESSASLQVAQVANSELISDKEALEQRRESMMKVRKEREEMTQQWIKPNRARQQSIAQVQAAALQLRKQQLKLSLQLREHEQRLGLARENVELSEMHAKELLERRRQELEERKRLQKEHAERLHAMRGVMLHNAMCSVIDQVEKEDMRNLVHQCFRMLRFPVIARKSFGMMQKQRIRNWVRICVRLRKLWRSMPRYHILRRKWQIFNNWLAFTDDKYKYESPGLRDELARRKDLLSRYSALLRSQGEDEAEGSKAAWFLRWVEFAQKSRARSCVVALTREAASLALERRVWVTWNTALKPRYTAAARGEAVEFRSQRIAYDLDRWKCKILGQERRLLSTKLRARNAFVRERLRYSVRAAASSHMLLKSAMQQHKEEVSQRLALESRLLCSSFEERATFSFGDKLSETVGLAPQDVGGARRFQDRAVASGCFIQAVIVAVSQGMVVGLQFKMRSGPESASRTWLTRMHGHKSLGVLADDEAKGDDDADADGAETAARYDPGLDIFEFHMLDSRERLIKIEGYALPHLVGGKLRFHTSSGRVSPWYGSGASGTRFALPGGPERMANGKLRFVEEFIIGVHGHESDTSILSLGVVVRQVEKKNVFSSCWMDRVQAADLDGPDEAASSETHLAFAEQQLQLHQRQFSAVLAMRCSGPRTACS